MSLSTQEILALGHKHLTGNVARFEMAVTHGRGMKLWDADGKEYVDFLGGIATCALGYAPEIIVKTLAEQAAKVIHVSNYFYNEPMVKLAALLTSASGLGKVFFCNSGAEANEAAIKLARKYSHDLHGPGRHGIITVLGSFHGRTMAAISASGQTRMREGFEPVLPGFTHVPYGDAAALEAAVTAGTCAVMMEPILGEGGVVTPPPDYLPAVAAICEEKGLLLILDEIQTGLGRTGRPFAFQHHGIKPHIMTLAKALGGGVASGAMLAADEVAAHLTPGSHSTTVGGAPLAMAVGLAMVETILAEDFLKNVNETGLYFRQRLEELAAGPGSGLVRAVRGRGLLLAMELSRPALPLVTELMRLGFLTNATAGTVLRFAPPLIVTPAEVDLLIPALRQAFETVYP